MRLAWCRAATDLSCRIDDTAALLDELRSHHDITRLEGRAMHDLVRLSFRQPFDLHVYELADTNDDEVLWPYVMHYPGIVWMRSASLHRSRAASLLRQRRARDHDAELAFGQGDLSAAPILASRLVVVADDYRAAALQRAYPGAQVRVAPTAIPTPPSDRRKTDTSSGRIRVGVLGHAPRHTIVSAVQRASESGATIELLTDTSPERVLDHADVVLHLPWPPLDDLTPAIAAMASARALAMFETGSSAGWPLLDPQTWQPRGFDSGATPIGISIDPRDEEHSLFLALRRLAHDATLRHELADAAEAWWSARSTVGHAVSAWEAILQEAAAIEPPAHAPGWPPHLTADGTERARGILTPFGISVEFLG